MAPTASRDGSSTSARARSPRSRRSARASRTSPSPGSARGLTPSALRALAARHGIRPRKSLGQHFLIEPTLARRIAALASVGPGSHVVEVGAGLGSLTVALAETGAEVVALELDRGLLAALEEVLAGRPSVRVVPADATRTEWDAVLSGPGPWAMVANLPYNVAVPVVMRALEEEPRIERMVVMVQREVGERLAARPGGREYGAVSVRAASLASARIVRPVSRSVFWPRPNVDSVLVEIVRRPPPAGIDRAILWRTVDVAFAERRKSMRRALARLGVPPERVAELLAGCGVDPLARPEELDLDAFACLATRAEALARTRKPS